MPGVRPLAAHLGGPARALDPFTVPGLCRPRRSFAAAGRPSAGVGRPAFAAAPAGTRPPIGTAALAATGRVGIGPTRLFWALPEASPCKPLHHDVGVGSAQLLQR